MEDPLTQRVIYDAGTQTIIGLTDQVYVIDIPPEHSESLEDMEAFCGQDMEVRSMTVIMPYCDGTLKPEAPADPPASQE